MIWWVCRMKVKWLARTFGVEGCVVNTKRDAAATWLVLLTHRGVTRRSCSRWDDYYV